MLLAHEPGPLCQGGDGWNQDDTFVDMAHYFSKEALRVPRILVDGRKLGALLLEDMGDLALWHFALGGGGEKAKKVEYELGRDAKTVLFERALKIISNLQNCEKREECIAFDRYLGVDDYVEEAMRFVNLYLSEKDLDSSDLTLIVGMIQELGERLSAHPKTLIHRDFMAWNIHVVEDARLALLDFQDALIGSHAYDLVSLLHDRDIDRALGDSSCKHLFEVFCQDFKDKEAFSIDYGEALLQRNLRLAGQFRALSQRTGLSIYDSWVPACLWRIGRVLACFSQWQEVLDVLKRVDPNVAKGAEDPLPYIAS